MDKPATCSLHAKVLKYLFLAPFKTVCTKLEAVSIVKMGRKTFSSFFDIVRCSQVTRPKSHKKAFLLRGLTVFSPVLMNGK